MTNGSVEPISLPRVGVLAKRGKTMGGGLPELRALLARAGYPDPLWAEVDRGKRVPKAAEDLVSQGAQRLLVWGGDGTVQRALAAAAGGSVELAVLPAGTANTFAQNLGIPTDLEGAVQVALGGWTARVDLGSVRGELFCVAAGVGFDALLVREADKSSKGRFGRAAYVVQGVRSAGSLEPVGTRVKVDGQTWFEGDATTVLVANAGTLMGGLRAFPDARMDDGKLEVGVVTAAGRLDWLRLAGRMAVGKVASSPFVDVTRGERITIRLDRRLPYEVDGGARSNVRKMKLTTRSTALSVCVPAPDRLPPAGVSAEVAESVSGS